MSNSLQLKAFWNFLQRNKLFTAINIFGFAVSLAFVVLIGLYVQDELSVDDFQANKERIFRLEYAERSNLPPALGAAVVARYPEIEAVTRIYACDLTVAPIAGFTAEENTADGLFVDSSFFSIFSYPFVEGSPATAMQTSRDVVLTRRFARRIFGNESATGRTLHIGKHDFTVGGVVDDFEHSVFRSPDILLPVEKAFAVAYGIDDPSQMAVINGNYDFGLYLLGRPGSDLATRLDTAELNRLFLEDLQLDLFRSGNINHPRLCPLKEVYLSPIPGQGTRSNTRTYLLILGATAALILLFAVINYINLSVAQSGFRAQEVAMRRLLGGSRGSLFAGFIVESLLLCFVSFGIALLLASTAEPWFRTVMQSDISVAKGFTTGNVVLALVGVGLIGTISGLVPAYVLTRTEPIDIVRGTFRRQTKMVYSKILITFQYGITIVLIGCTITIGRQLDFMRHSDLGFDSAHVIICKNRFTASQRDAVRGELMSIPGVTAVSFADNLPGIGHYNGRYGHYDLDRRLHDLAGFNGDSAFLNVLGIVPLRETGRVNADGRRYWLTETAWRDLELAEDATEYTRGENPRYNFAIAGLLRDFHADNFTEPILPAVVCVIPEYRGRQVLIRVTPAAGWAVMDHIAEVYNRHAGGNYFNGRFLQQEIDNQYRTQQRMGEMVGVFALLAIVISALGMLAMATYFMRQREREVAVRKVFGSTSRQALARVMASFLKLVGVAFVVAVPVIGYLMRGWLAGYAYRIPLSWTIYALAGAVALLIAGSSVLWQSWRTVRANPVDVLRK